VSKLGKLGGKKGGAKRMDKPAAVGQRLAREAARARWGKATKKR
jgi:hypothetical protein